MDAGPRKVTVGFSPKLGALVSRGVPREGTLPVGEGRLPPPVGETLGPPPFPLF